MEPEHRAVRQHAQGRYRPRRRSHVRRQRSLFEVVFTRPNLAWDSAHRCIVTNVKRGRSGIASPGDWIVALAVRGTKQARRQHEAPVSRPLPKSRAASNASLAAHAQDRANPDTAYPSLHRVHVGQKRLEVRASDLQDHDGDRMAHGVA